MPPPFLLVANRSGGGSCRVAAAMVDAGAALCWDGSTDMEEGDK